jgi:hypothetical protein
VAGIRVADPAAQAVAAAQPTAVPTVQAAPAGVARPPVVIGAYVPANQVRAQGAGLPISNAPAGATIDSNTADDTIVDVVDDSQTNDKGSGLSQAVTSLPADVQMLGYRLMWGLAGLISLGGAAVSWFAREEEEQDVPAVSGVRAPALGAGGGGRRPAASPSN